MGSVTVIFLLPLFFLMSFFSSVYGDITGSNRTQVVLPYDPTVGIVWEYDGVNDPLKLVETEVDGDKQIFTFAGSFSKELSVRSGYGDVYDLIFTDKNGNQLKYFAERSDEDLPGIDFPNLSKYNIYSPDECVSFEITLNAQIPKDGAHWESNNPDKSNTVYAPLVDSPQATFTVARLGDDWTEGSEYSHTFSYVGGKYWEDVSLEYKIVNGKAVITDEKQTVNTYE